MRFNSNLKVDFAKWSQVKMERENNMREYKGIDEEQPKYFVLVWYAYSLYGNYIFFRFGAGSEFGREAKEEARRKKLGIVARKYKPEDQPWILKCCGSSVKKFKGMYFAKNLRYCHILLSNFEGIREGGVSENAAYYVFTHAAEGLIEAFPLHEW